jgi:hypothetical protein
MPNDRMIVNVGLEKKPRRKRFKLINESIKPSTQQFFYNKHSHNEICHFSHHYMFRSIFVHHQVVQLM